jgi:hypothetical protein
MADPPHDQFFRFGSLSVSDQKSTMAASINLKSVTKHPNGLFVLIMAQASLQR